MLDRTQAVCLLVLLVVVVASAPCLAAPAVSSVSDSMPVHGQSLVVSGTGFGAKSVAAPTKYDGFENGIDGAILTSTGYWHVDSDNATADRPQYSNDETRHARSSLSAKFIEYGLQDIAYTPDLGFTGRKIYMDLWLRFQWASLTAQHQNKLFKIQSLVNNSGGSNQGAYPIFNFYAWRYDGGGTWCYTPLSNENGTVSQPTISCMGAAPAWYHWQVEIQNNDIGSANGDYRMWRDGSLLAEDYNLEIRLAGDNNFKSVWLGRYLGNYEGQLTNTLYYDDVYLDNSWARVEVGNAATWSACAHREMQIPAAWADGSVTVDVNQGSFASGTVVYLYVTDPDGTVNAAGFPITVGGLAYTLTVNSGAGDGAHYFGDIVAIEADQPDSGTMFDVWIGDTGGIADVSAAATTLTMPASNVEITATYTDAVYAVLTVNSGSGSDIYPQGAIVAISADPDPPGMLFDVWTGDAAGIADIGAESTTITMPDTDTEITATYQNLPDGAVYQIDFSDADSSPAPGNSWYTKTDASRTTVTLTDSTGSTYGGESGHGVTMTLGLNWLESSAANQNGAFEGGDFSAAAEDFFYTASSAASVTFKFYGIAATKDWEVELVASRGSAGSSRTADYLVEGGYSDSGNSDDFNSYDDGYVAGELMIWNTVTPDGSNEVTISAIPAVYNNYGYISAIRLSEIIEEPTYMLTVNSGSGDGEYDAGEIADIDADAPAAGKEFDAWTGDTDGVADVSLASTTLTMPAASQEITATYTDITYTLTVNSGTGDGIHEPGEIVAILADAPPTDKPAFREWTGDTDDVADTYASSTTLTMPAVAQEVTATFRYRGDVNRDGVVGGDDLAYVLDDWGENVPPADPWADESGDGFVGGDDLAFVLDDWGKGF